MKNDTLIHCACCTEEGPVSAAVIDTEIQGHVCPDGRKELRNAKAVLGMPADGKGREINIKGCYRENDAPDNL